MSLRQSGALARRAVLLGGVVLAVLLAVSPLWAADTLRVLAATHQPEILREALAAYSQSTGIAAEIICTDNDKLPQDFVDQGPFDILVASCTRSGAKWEQQGLVDPTSRGDLWWQRMAAFVLPQDPEGILNYQDLQRPGLRIGLQKLCEGRADQTLASIKQEPVLRADSSELLVYALRQHYVDAIITFDASLAAYANELVTVRLPKSVYGPMGATPVPAYVTTNSPHREAAAQAVSFLAKSDAARHIYLQRALMTDDGVADAQSYDQGAGQRFAAVYHGVCQQLIDDYGITTGRALDIGCGPGQMTLELARMTKLAVTGLDIEPEVTEIATRHAQDAGLADRVQFVAADAHALPFPDASFDLVVSRGTWPFLRDHVRAFQEVYRVMKPGAVALIGCGRGKGVSAEAFAQVFPRGEREKGFFLTDGVPPEKNMFPFPLESFEAIMLRAGIPPDHYKAMTEGGNWIELRK